MTVSVLVPWRPTPDRLAAWEYLRAKWVAAGYEVVEGSCPDGPWRKAAAVADALTRSTGKILVVADADVWCDEIDAAVARVTDGAAWAVPHWRVCRLDQEATQRALDGAPLGEARTFDRRPYVGRRGGGMVVLSRDLYDEVPLDPRFAGWGHEDDAWAAALRCLAGEEWRGLADLWHLFHEPQRYGGTGRGSAESQALYRRYVEAKRYPSVMRALLDEIGAAMEKIVRQSYWRQKAAESLARVVASR